MDQKKLLEKLEELEWEDFEVKEARNSIPKNSFETVSAFANTSGGWLVFGVKQAITITMIFMVIFQVLLYETI